MAESRQERDGEKPAPLPRITARWMGWGVAVALLIGGPGGFLYYRYHEVYERSPPRMDVCFTALGGRLKRPTIVAPSEPYTLDDGQTYYLTDAQMRAAGCAARLPGTINYTLVRTWAIEDPDEQAVALGKLVLDLPPDKDHDREAFGLWRLAGGTLDSLPQSETRDKAKADIDQAIACRFSHPQLPPCPTRPPFPTHTAVLGGIGALGLLAVLGGLLVNTVRYLIARRARKRAARSSATVPAS
jgi:hypothetical protein